MKSYSLDELSDMWADDGPIVVSDIVGQLSEIAVLHNKYFRILNIEKLRHRKYTLDHKKLIRDKSEYYLGVLDEDTLTTYNWKPFEMKVLRSELPTYLDGDADVAISLMKIETAKVRVDYLESIIKMVNVRGLQLRAIIDQRRFEAGLNGK